jgi:hypothetical protein
MRVIFHELMAPGNYVPCKPVARPCVIYEDLPLLPRGIPGRRTILSILWNQSWDHGGECAVFF